MAAQITSKAVWPLIKRTFNEWLEDKVPKMSAALAYYLTISLAPLLVITLKIVGVVFGAQAAGRQLHDQIAARLFRAQLQSPNRAYWSRLAQHGRVRHHSPK